VWRFGSFGIRVVLAFPRHHPVSRLSLLYATSFVRSLRCERPKLPSCHRVLVRPSTVASWVVQARPSSRPSATQSKLDQAPVESCHIPTPSLVSPLETGGATCSHGHCEKGSTSHG
jgi:hypothetical protein